ncbi:MAG: glucose 1-dehydrogenase [Clostridiales bacterium]|nr:glucose 1-dehydrogenase [Clostridiales bacterium]
MKTVLITGASRGIGEQIARAFSTNGYNVIINYNKSEERAKKLGEELNAPIFKADVSKFDQAKALVDFAVEKFGKIDVLVNNAGIALPQKVLQEVTEEEFDNIVAVNLKSTFNCSKLVIDLMISNGGGSIINISSIWGQVGASCEAVYSMTKAGVIGFTKSMAQELALSNIRVNAVAPGFIKTDMNAHLSNEDIDDFLQCVPLNRIGSTEEVAQAVLFLASDQASYITGHVLNVNGGMN